MLTFFRSKRKLVQEKPKVLHDELLSKIVLSWVGNFHNALRDDFILLDNLNNYSADEILAKERVERFSAEAEKVRLHIVNTYYANNANNDCKELFLAHLQKAATEAQLVVYTEKLQTAEKSQTIGAAKKAKLQQDIKKLHDKMADDCFALARVYGGSNLAHNFMYKEYNDFDFVKRSTRYYHQAMTHKDKGLEGKLTAEQLMQSASYFQEMALRYAPVHANESKGSIENALSAITCVQAALISEQQNKAKTKLRLRLAELYLDLAKRYKLSNAHDNQHVRDALLMANYYLAEDYSPKAVKLKTRVDFLSQRYHELLHSDPLRKVRRSLRVYFNFNKFMRSLIALNQEANAISTSDSRERAYDFYQEYLCALFASKNDAYLTKLYLKIQARQNNICGIFNEMMESYAAEDDFGHCGVISSFNQLLLGFLGSLEKVLMDRGVNVDALNAKVKPVKFPEVTDMRYRKIIDILLLQTTGERLQFLLSIAPEPSSVQVEMRSMK